MTHSFSDIESTGKLSLFDLEAPMDRVEIRDIEPASKVNDSTMAENGAYLIWYKDNKKILINKPIFRIGKEQGYVDCYISRDISISRVHASILKRGNSYFITDCHSSNGTYVNGNRLSGGQEYLLHSGDVIRLAGQKFEFVNIIPTMHSCNTQQYVSKELYNTLRNGIEKRCYCIKCLPVSEECINKTLHQILLDNPQLCHFEGDWKWEDGVIPTYTLDDTQRNQLTTQVGLILQQLDVEPSASDLEKAAIIYRWFVENISYDRSAAHNQSAYGALVERKAVCKGIAKAYQLLLQQLGITCKLVEGSLDGIMKHVWNQYFVDGIWYHSDITMSYPQFRYIIAADGVDYSAASASQICRTHTIWSFEEEPEKEKFFQSLQKQCNSSCDKSVQIPASLQRFLIGEMRFLASGSVSDVYQFGSNVLKRISCGNDLGKLYCAMRECAMLQRVSSCSQIAQLQAWDVIREQDDYVVYLVLQYGQPLEEYCSRVKLSTQRAVALVKSACTALQECYTAGVAHLDIQPGNFLVNTFNNTIKLTDFSSAVPVEDVMQLDEVRGTPAYLAPEIYYYRAYSQAADVYSLGILLYCILNNGKLPYGDVYPAHEAVQRRIEGLPVKLMKDMPRTLRACVEKACSFDPAKRYLDLQSFAIALDEVEKSLSEKQSAENYFPVSQRLEPPVLLKNTLYTPPCFSADTIGETTVLCAPSSQPAPELVRVDKVQFSAIAPQKALKGEYTLVQLYMYEQEFRSAVEEALQMGDAPMQEKKSGYHTVQRNTCVKVVLSSRDLEITDNIVEETWTGGYLSFDFALDVPEGFVKRQILLNATVYFNNIPATRLLMTLQLQTPHEQRLELLRRDVLSAFVSYASQDRTRVASLIQGMKKARPDMDIFFDVNNLRSGENWESTLRWEIEQRDILFLCWSQNAKNSTWVDMEWRYALKNKGLEAIEPIPIESPDVCPPPEELYSKHFNDSLLYIINKSQ